jgi:hypothetical protein
MDYVAGDGDYALEVVSGSRHQDRLEWLAQGRGEDPKDYACTAILTHEPDNPFDSNAVSISVLGVRVGFLPRDAAADFVAAMQTWGFERASCDAIVEGGWYRSADDKGDFCVRLDVNPEFVPADALIADEAADQARATPVAATPPQAGYDARSMGFGAAAMFTAVALLGVVWLVVQPPDEREAGRRSAVAALVQTPEPAAPGAPRLASSEAERKVAPASETPGVTEVEQASQAAAGSRVETMEARSAPKAVASAAEGPASEPAPVVSGTGSARLGAITSQPAVVVQVDPVKAAAASPPAVVEAAVKDQPVREAAATGAVGAGPAESPTSVTADRQTPVAAMPPPAVEEVQAAIAGKRVTAISATPVASEVPPPEAVAFPPPSPPPPPSRPSRSGPTEASSPPQQSVQAAKPVRKVRSSERRSRFSRRSRASRSYSRSRNARRFGRSRQTAQERQDSPAASAGPPNSGNALQDSPAARMLRGWTEEWTSASPVLRQKRSAQ